MENSDYIRFRCSTELKRTAEKRATCKGLSLTEYLKYLIRKDEDGMMYIYWLEKTPDEFGDDILEILKERGLGVIIDGEYLLSKNESITINNSTIKAYQSFGEWIKGLSNMRDIAVAEGITIYEDSVIQTFIGELYQPANDQGETYADIIYNSENPFEKIKEYLRTFTSIYIDFKMTDINIAVSQIKKKLEDGTFEWG